MSIPERPPDIVISRTIKEGRGCVSYALSQLALDSLVEASKVPAIEDLSDVWQRILCASATGPLALELIRLLTGREPEVGIQIGEQQTTVQASDVGQHVLTSMYLPEDNTPWNPERATVDFEIRLIGAADFPMTGQDIGQVVLSSTLAPKTITEC